MGYAISIMVSHNKLYIELYVNAKQHLTALSGFVQFWLAGAGAPGRGVECQSKLRATLLSKWTL
jgi:hypothetical protein